ncbi:hypothetical protein ACWENA_29235 [Streptomyces sp. NPDC004779]|uniref:hypothetical protein n=1 Tax=Streptomyces sp. NPDC056049 TaxID=3345693 RepID=UPI0035DBE3D7
MRTAELLADTFTTDLLRALAESGAPDTGSLHPDDAEFVIEDLDRMPAATALPTWRCIVADPDPVSQTSGA